MKSVVVPQPGGLDKLTIEIKEMPSPKTGEVLVQWHATSLNFHDFLVAIGAIPVEDRRIPMSDGAGEIVAVGAGVNDWKKGDKVMSMFFPNWVEGKPTLPKTQSISGETSDGFLTEYSCVPATSITKMPRGYSFAQAATLPCAGLTAWRALMVEGRLQMGDTVLVEGTGGMSIFALQLAKAAGATVYATTSSNDKAERLKTMGIEAVVNYKDDPKWGKTIFKMTNGGVDHVLDVGGGSTMRQSIEAVKIGGHISSIGILGNGRKGEITFPKLFFKHIRLIGIAVGNKEMQEQMTIAIDANNIEPIVDKSFAFDQLVEAFQYQTSGQHFGKIVLEW